MKSILKWLGYSAALVVVMAGLAIAFVYLSTEPLIRKTYDQPLTTIFVPTDPSSIAEGQRLARIRGCFDSCHGEGVAGGLFDEVPWLTRLVAPNLTRVAASHSDAELERVIRHGVRKNGKSVWGMPSSMFYHLSDEDLGKIIAFLRSVPLSEGPAAEAWIGPLWRLDLMRDRYLPYAEEIERDAPWMSLQRMPWHEAAGGSGGLDTESGHRRGVFGTGLLPPAADGDATRWPEARPDGRNGQDKIRAFDRRRSPGTVSLPPFNRRCHVSQSIRVFVTGLVLALPAWAGTSECSSLSSARWVLGDWVTGGEKTVFHESWTVVGSQTFEGMGSERSMADGVFYIAKLTHNELPVAFQLTECSADRLVSENPAHDFPRRLECRQDADGRMLVAVSDGKDRGFTLNFERAAAAADPGAPVLAAEDARFAAMTSANVSELGSWLADDLEYVHSTGKVENREQFLASNAGGTLRYLEIAPMERQVVMLGHDSALVRGHGRIVAMASGTRLDMEIRYSAIYGLGGDDRWRLRFWQSLRMPQTSG
jgi:hypothetical protein